MELNVLGLRRRTFNCQLEKVKQQIGYIFYIVKYSTSQCTLVQYRAVQYSAVQVQVQCSAGALCKYHSNINGIKLLPQTVYTLL